MELILLLVAVIGFIAIPIIFFAVFITQPLFNKAVVARYGILYGMMFFMISLATTAGITITVHDHLCLMRYGPNVAKSFMIIPWGVL